MTQQQQHSSSADSSAAKPRVKPDWEAVERDYRLGTYTVRELGAKYGVDNSIVVRRAAKEGWTKDLSSAVRKATNAALIAETVQQHSSAAQQTTAIAVSAAAEVAKGVILGHRTELQRARRLALALLQEVEGQASLAANDEALAGIMAGENATAAEVSLARAALRKVLSTGSRVISAKALGDTLAKLHAGERIAFSLDGPGEADTPLAARLKAISESDVEPHAPAPTYE